MRRRAGQVNCRRNDEGLSPVHALGAVPPPRIEAVLHFSLVFDEMEDPVAQRDQHDDRDQPEEIAAPAWGRLAVIAVRRRRTHAERLAVRRSTSPSAAIALATMPLASSPAAAYMRSGLS